MSWLRYCTTLLDGGQPNFAQCLAVSCAVSLYIHFWGLLPANRIFATCEIYFASKSCVLLLYWHGYCTALEQWLQPNWSIQQKAPPAFGMAAITLCIGSHCGLLALTVLLLCCLFLLCSSLVPSLLSQGLG